IYTLLPGQPILTYRTIFENAGDEAVYLAYVGIGGGMRGGFGDLLDVEPVLKYEDPGEPSRILLSGPSNGYTRVAWRGEKCWLGVQSGSGCGIGFSTSDDVTTQLLGSTVWAVWPSEFTICLIDAERGNFPYKITPDHPVDTGLAFVATCGDVGIWNQTHQVFAGVTKDKRPGLNTPYAVYLGGVPLQPAETDDFKVSEKASGLIASGDEGSRQAALAIDFQRAYRLSAKASQTSESSPVRVVARPMDGGAEVEVMSLSQAGEKEVNFTELTGWEGKRQSFILEVNEASGARLDKLTLSPAPFPAPELSSPADGMSMTDLATFFRWKIVPGTIDYELQMARDAEFSAPRTFPVRSEIEWPIFLPEDNQLPTPGTWFWRVRAIEGKNPGDWSEARRLDVNDDHAKTPLKFQITPERPLFTMELRGATDFRKFKNTIPEDLKPYTAFNTAEKFGLIDLLRPLQEADQKFFIRTHHPSSVTGWTPLAEVEAVFQAYPNAMGVMGGESLSSLYSGGLNQIYTHRLLKICGKYGRLFYEADGTYPTDNKWDTLYAEIAPLLKEYSDYLIFAQKNNILHRQFVSQSAVLGLYLSDAITNQGSWEDGGWYWQQVGFRKLGEIRGQRGGVVRDMPKIFWDLTFVMGISRGCAVYSLDGQTGSVRVGEGYRISEKGLPANASPSGYWTSEGELTPVFHRYIAPFMRGVIEHRMVPSKEQVLDQIHLAVYNDGVPEKEDSEPYYHEYWPLYDATYGFESAGVIPGELMEFFPNTGQYYYIPVFPQGKADLGHGIETLALSQLQESAAVKTRFDGAYPKWYEGDALVTIVGDTLTVLNSNENQDVTVDYIVPLENRQAFTEIAGKIGPHAYVMGKFEDGDERLWLQANTEYPERDTELTFACDERPQVRITPESAAKSNLWHEAAGKLSLRLSHADGAVELEIFMRTVTTQQNPTAEAQKKVDPALVAIADVPGLPRVLLIGDSISMGYTPAVRDLLKGVANVHRPLANCGSTKVGLRDLDSWLGEGKWDVIHFNFGLHDLRQVFDGDQFQDADGNYPVRGQGVVRVTPEEYERNLRELVGRLKQTGAKLIWCSTTPLAVDFHGYFSGREAKYNKVAAGVMAEEEVAIHDLWAFAMPRLKEIGLADGNPHFTAKGYQAMAEPVAENVRMALQE
ncbi:hypothetical protein HQ520_09455, partial [bacterium]|nr:hypothetical protein [bacterium]